MRVFFLNAHFGVVSVLISSINCFSMTSLLSPTTVKYTELVAKLTEIEKLIGVKLLLGWDEKVMLSPGSSAARNDQKSAISGVIYEKQTSPILYQIISDLLKDDLSVLPSDYERAIVRDAYRDYELNSRKSKSIAMREAEVEGRGYQIWAEARAENNFNKFAPVLQEIIKLKMEIGSITHPHLSPYDANIDMFERGMSTKRLNEIFNTVEKELVPLIKSIGNSDVKKKYTAPIALLGGEKWSVGQQKAMCTEFAEKIGFDFSRGRFDVSIHPFCEGFHPSDVRITTRYSTDNWLQGVAATVHEVGHALYKQGKA